MKREEEEMMMMEVEKEKRKRGMKPKVASQCLLRMKVGKVMEER